MALIKKIKKTKKTPQWPNQKKKEVWTLFTLQTSSGSSRQGITKAMAADQISQAVQSLFCFVHRMLVAASNDLNREGSNNSSDPTPTAK